MNFVTCRRCGWVHFSYTLAEAQQQVERFNAYFDRLTPEQQQDHYGGIDGSPPQRSNVDRYYRCFRCGGLYTDFRDSVDGDCPRGVTINPILHYDEPMS